MNIKLNEFIKPDFSKLKKGDHIIFEIMDEDFKEGKKAIVSGFFSEICENYLRISFRKDNLSTWDGYPIKNIINVTRINSETKEFEEI